MKHSVFLSRTPVVTAEEFIGREESLAWLEDKLKRQVPQNCNVVGEPRIGKTSLLYRAYQSQIGLPTGFSGLYVWFPLAELPALDSASFWRAMLERLHETAAQQALSDPLSPPDIDQNLSPREQFDRVYAAIEHLLTQGNLQRLILFIDDFDLFAPLLNAEDLDWLRSLVMSFSDQFAFVISTFKPLIQLVPNGSVSPFPNVFENRHLGLLAPDAAENLICKAAEIERVPTPTDADVSFLLHEVGRHPDLLKLACTYLFEELEFDADAPREEVYADVRGDVRYDGHARWLFRQLINRRREEEKGVLHLLAQAKPVQDRIVLRHLERKLGLVKKCGRQPKLFCEAFQAYLRSEADPAADVEPVASPASETAAHFAYIPDRRLVYVDGETRKLTKLENRLLDYLMAHPNEVCTTTQLLDNVWGPGRSESVVEKAVNRLRKKVEEDPGRPRRIVSARGEGYMLLLEQPD